MAKADSKEKAAGDLTAYLDKEATTAQARFADWLIDKVGIKPAKLDGDEAFREGVRLAKALIMVYQASPENRAANEEERANRAEAAKARKDELAQKRAAKAAAEKESGGKAATKSTAKKAPAKKAPAKKAAKPKPRSSSKPAAF